MYGAIIGDIVGSRFENINYRHKNFHLFSNYSCFTDDTAMTVAVAEALLTDGNFTAAMQKWGRRYPRAGYGGKFITWIFTPDPKPYGSWGNGSAMRVSPCALVAGSLEEALALAEKSAVVTHNHPEGIKGAKAVAAAVYMAKTGAGKAGIRRYIEENFYPLDRTLDEMRPGYRFDASCQGSVPQAIQAFLESKDFEDAVRNAVSLGGDSDTIAAMAGSIAWGYYSREAGPTPRMREIWQEAAGFLPEEILETVRKFSEVVDR
ncbi:MAG: ADP-ribosylglycohydrolase family protein [Oscillospiraceae bacterium]|nr:ADP-ribosylglycohydrolase family protein [Oscillospiraceae bacterium]